MKRLLSGVLFAAMASGTWFASAQGALVITEVLSQSAHPPGSANGDWWELTNDGASSLNLQNYSWDDVDAIPGTSVFPNVTVGPGESILVVDESSANIGGFASAWDLPASVQVVSRELFTGPINFSGLSGGGDQVNLFDPSDSLLSSVSFGDADGGGKTFQWGTSGAFLGFSNAGTNGAFVADGDGAGGDGIDVGSPGLSVAGQIQTSLVITEVMSESRHPGGPANGDWWELTNKGPGDIDLGGFSWDDNDAVPGNTIFPNITIGGGESIILVDEADANLADFKNAWGLDGAVQVLDRDRFTGSVQFSGLSALGDELYLYDASGVELTSVTFGDSAGGGKSFEWDVDGTSLGFSEDDENGAYVALNDGAGGSGIDVGSPGIAIGFEAIVVGDLDCDGDVDFDDIGAFVLGLTDAAGYEATYGVPPDTKGDIDDDGDLDFDDIPGFVDILTGQATTRSVPEPSTLLYVVAAVLACLAAARRSLRRG